MISSNLDDIIFFAFPIRFFSFCLFTNRFNRFSLNNYRLCKTVVFLRKIPTFYDDLEELRQFTIISQKLQKLQEIPNFTIISIEFRLLQGKFSLYEKSVYK